MNADRWSKLMVALGLAGNRETFDALTAAYSEKHRHYHTGDHIEACLGHLAGCAGQAHHREEIELALWFHDAIYQPLSNKNEKRSADWAVSFLQANNAPAEVSERVRRLIMATEHNVETRTKDESLLVDIDLSILGADAKTYAAFEQAVRREYRIIPLFVYRKKRVAILQGFLRRPQIFENEPFYTEREQRARVNLTNAVTRLAGLAR